MKIWNKILKVVINKVVFIYEKVGWIMLMDDLVDKIVFDSFYLWLSYV